MDSDYYPDDIAQWGDDDNDMMPTGCIMCFTDAEELEITRWGMWKRHWLLDCPYCGHVVDAGIVTWRERVRNAGAVMVWAVQSALARLGRFAGRSASDDAGDIPF